MLHPGDVVAISVLIRARIGQHDAAIETYRKAASSGVFTKEQVDGFVSSEEESRRYYASLLARFQQAVE